MEPRGFIFLFIGLFSFCGGFFGWNWFLNHRKARGLIRLIGLNAARIFYMVLGAGFTITGVLILSGYISLN